MSSKDLERSAAVYELKRRGGTGDIDAVPRQRTGEEPKAPPERASGPIERTLELDGCCALDRTSIEALEALLTALDPADELRLTLALGGEAPVRLGLALGDADRSEAQRAVLEAGLEFATALVGSR
jgi:hypothetical protein